MTHEEFARALGILPDNPERTAPYDYELSRPSFEDLPVEQQLDICEVACRRLVYEEALHEAFSLDNANDFRTFIGMLLDSSVSADNVGHAARALAVKYLGACAMVRREDLTELLGG